MAAIAGYKDPYSVFLGEATVPAGATAADVGKRLQEQAEKILKGNRKTQLQHAIESQSKFRADWERAARQDGVDHTELPATTVDVIKGAALEALKLKPEDIQRMEGFMKVHQVCKAYDKRVSIVTSEDGTVKSVQVNTAQPYAQSSKFPIAKSEPQAPPKPFGSGGAPMH